MQYFDKAVCPDNKSAITMCNHFIRYSMDDTVREIRKKRGQWLQSGKYWFGACSWANARARICGLGARAYVHGLCVCCDWDWTDETLVYLSGPV